MKHDKRRSLEEKGWTVGSASEFLDLTPEEAQFIEYKLRLARTLRELRERQSLTQVEVAKRIQSSQSRVAKMEAGDPSVSLDLLVRSLLLLGISSKELGTVFGP